MLEGTDTIRSRLEFIFLFALVAVGVGFRFFFLNADPSYTEWIGYITDEGRWAGTARDIALYGHHELTGLSALHIAIAPLYQFFVWVSFEAFGVDFWTARLFSAICGSVLLILATRFLWRIGVTMPALFVGAVVLALQPDLVFLSRVAIPEMAATLVHFFAFMVLLRDTPTMRSTIIAGLITVAGVAMKATTIPIIFIFIAIAAYCTTAGRKQQIQHALGFTIGVAVPCLLGLAAILLSSGAPSLDSVIATVTRLAGISNFYDSIELLIENRSMHPVNLLLLTAWCVGTLVILRGIKYQSLLGRVYIASAIWAAGWITIASLMSYFPLRYFFPVLVPLAIHLSTGFSLLAIEPADKPPTRTRITKNWVTAAAVSLPIAIILTPLLLGLIGELLPDAHRMRSRIALILFFAAVLSIIGRRIPATNRILAATTFFPVLAAIGWFLAVISDVLPPFFWSSAELQYTPIWITIVMVAAAVCVAATVRLNKLQEIGPAFAGTLTAAMMLIFLVQLIPNYFDRHYTIRNASIDIGQVLKGANRVHSSGAESLFLANRVSFTTNITLATPTHIVVGFGKIRPERLTGYSKTQSYALYRHRKLVFLNPELNANPELANPTIKIYQFSQPLE